MKRDCDQSLTVLFSLGAVLQPDSWKESNVGVRQKKRAVIKSKGGNSETDSRECRIQLSDFAVNRYCPLE